MGNKRRLIMVSVSNVLSSPSDAYSGYRNTKTKVVSVLYDDKNIRDEESVYEFRPDGSASKQSLAWGVRTELPAGTFSDVLLKLPETENLNKKTAQQLAEIYDNAEMKRNKKV